ncbi:lysine-2,3-aminomutase-like protein [Elioraea tepida]|jgi:lysine 2,3-aminomutase|uniref:Lysine-2,3-aminomutase-like protein n=1 Tax=Elioraea tepida TaxID=2843330 RepID=A0A975YKL8_9PROT|nr:lysine-2,3-aminomutase-like protein [Elioraea tepida]QXM25597.1 lysine-2,3-aminomutase-like protein [Elioraea tepida]
MPDGTAAPAAPPKTLRTMAALASAGLVRVDELPKLEAVAERYAIAVTPHVASLIDRDDPADPIAAQYVPHPDEAVTRPDEHPDPIGDDRHSPVRGIVHRYPDRVLLKPLLACPVYCRFCFRRESVGPDGGVLADAELEAAYAYVRARPQIREVILTGGDPLMLSPRRLGAILQALDAIPHLETLRIHTRVPVAEPSLVTPALAAALATEKPLWLMVHVNHARELSPAALEALGRIRAAGVPILSQSVLLRGVNDCEAALEQLFRALIAARVKPAYLHHLDRAPGTARFRVPLARGRALMRRLRGRIPGHALPIYVVDIAGGHGKVPVGESHAERDGEGWLLTAPDGSRHRLADTGESG